MRFPQDQGNGHKKKRHHCHLSRKAKQKRVKHRQRNKSSERENERSPRSLKEKMRAKIRKTKRTKMIKILKGDIGYSVVLLYNTIYYKLCLFNNNWEICCMMIGCFSSSKTRQTHKCVVRIDIAPLWKRKQICFCSCILMLNQSNLRNFSAYIISIGNSMTCSGIWQ